VSSLFISTALRRIVVPAVVAALAIGFAARVSRASDTSAHRLSSAPNGRLSAMTPRRRPKAPAPYTRNAAKRRSHQGGKPRTRTTTHRHAGSTKPGRTQVTSRGGAAMATHPTRTSPAATTSGASPQQAGASETANSDTTPELFAPTSVWNQPLSSTAAIDPNSGAMVSDLATQAAAEYQQNIGPYIETTGTTTMYEVGADQPTVRVQLSDPTLWWRVALQSAFDAVPIPVNAQPAAGSDAEMTIWQPSTDKLWEFFEMQKEADGWHAAWGGAIQGVSQSPGYYATSSWPGALSVWGATASSLPAAAGVITLQDIQQGHINHALALELPSPRAGTWAWPAQRSDGTGTDPNAIPEGAQLRLDPNLNLATLHLPPLTMMIAQAAQRYGMIVRDQTHHAIGLYAENPLPLGSSPYYTSGTPNPTGPFGGQWPDTLLHSFPWSSLEVLKMNLHPS
jgi:hypothetical protein